jgi:hypothetical protein
MQKLSDCLRPGNITGCSIIMDSAKYHKRLPTDVHIKSSLLVAMQSACDRYGLRLSTTDTKAAILWEKLARHIDDHIEPVVVSKAREYGHQVVNTPSRLIVPTSNDLQRIEYVRLINNGEVVREFTADTTFAQVRCRLDAAFPNQ